MQEKKGELEDNLEEANKRNRTLSVQKEEFERKLEMTHKELQVGISFVLPFRCQL